MTITRAVEIRSHAVFPLLTGISSAANAVAGSAAVSASPPTTPYMIRLIRLILQAVENADEPGSPGCLAGVSRARAGCRVGQAEAKRMRLGCREPSDGRLGCATVTGPPCCREGRSSRSTWRRVWPMVNVRTRCAQASGAGRQRQTQGDLGTQSHGTRATESAGLPKPIGGPQCGRQASPRRSRSWSLPRSASG